MAYSPVRKGPMAPMPERPEIAKLIDATKKKRPELLSSLSAEQRYWYLVAEKARQVCHPSRSGETKEACFRRYFVLLHEDEEVADWLLAHTELRAFLGLT